MGETGGSKVQTSARREPAAVSAGLERWLSAELGVETSVTGLTAPAGAGFSNETYVFEAHDAGRTRSLVVQAAPTGEALFPSYDIAVMARVQQRLGELGTVPVASIVGFETSPGPLGSAFFVMDRVPGRVPTDSPPYHQEGWFAAESPSVRSTAWETGLRAMVALHEVRVDDGGFGFLAAAPWGMSLGAEPARERLRQWSAFAEWATPNDPLPAFDDAVARLGRALPPTPDRLAVHWGDAKVSNCVLGDDGSVRALLDWELCGVSDPWEDASHWAMIDWMCEHRAGSRLMGVPGPAATVERYAELSGRDPRAARWWFTFGLVRLAAITQRILVRMRAHGQIPAGLPLASINSTANLLPTVLDWSELP